MLCAFISSVGWIVCAEPAMRKRANVCVADFHVVVCIYCAEVTQRQYIIKRAPTTLEVEGMFELVLIAERCSRTRTKFDVFVNWENP